MEKIHEHNLHKMCVKVLMIISMILAFGGLKVVIAVVTCYIPKESLDQALQFLLDKSLKIQLI